MNATFHKYQALENDFLVFESNRLKISRRSLGSFARAVCHRRTGVGADGILVLSSSRKADRKVDIYNADGTWAEKSGNGLRIAAVYLSSNSVRRQEFNLETGSSIDRVELIRKSKRGWTARAELAGPEFDVSRVPVRSQKRHLINAPLKIAGIELPVTCLSVGNPHTVIVVKDLNFDWRTLGADLEWSRPFPNGTNVEFVRIHSSRHLQVAEWERGAGATGSSGTGAAAAVCALVIQGLAKRRCRVDFPAGSLNVNWNSRTDKVELTGPVDFVSKGQYTYP